MATRGLHHLSFLILACILSSTDCAKQSYESAETLNRSSFPAGFVFGASSASYQSEGAAFQDGRGLSIWDTFTHYYPEKIEDHSTGAVADEFYYSCNYKEDILLMKNIGLDAFRFSISWPRILPNVRKPPKDFRQSYHPGKGLKKLLDLPLQQRKAPLVLNFIPSYTSKLADVLKKKKKKSASPSTASTEQAASTSEPADQPSTSAPNLIPVTEKKRRRRLVKTAEMERPKKVVLDLLADLPDDMDDAPSQTVPPPKPKRVKKAQPKAKATEVDAEAEDAVPISQLTSTAKTNSVPAKRSAGAQPSGSTPAKKQKSSAGTSSGSKVPKIPWEPKITLEDRPVYANESASDINVGVALSMAVLIEGDLEKNSKISEYENYALMLQRSVQAVQHAHSFSVKAFETREELSELKKEFSALQKLHKRDQLKMKKLEDQAEAATKAQQIAQQKAEAAEDIRKVTEAEKKEAEAKRAEAEKELRDALATKKAEVDAAYNQGMADVAEDYKLQVKQACNKGYSLGWNALAKQLDLPADSPWRKTKAMRLSCPLPSPSTQVEEETDSEAEAEDEGEDEDEALVRKAKSPPKGEQVLDLTGDEDLEAAPKKADIGTLSSDLLLAERSVDETLAEINAEVAADKVAEVTAKEAEDVAEKDTEVEEQKDAEEVLPESSEVPTQPSVQVEEGQP